MITEHTQPSDTAEALHSLFRASGITLARWLEELTPEQIARFDALLAAGGTPGADVLLAATGPTVTLYVADPNGTRHPLLTARMPPAPTAH
ncbi:hypothetical protein [Hydrogenophaga taeniospiralis]|uniref:hypothetical protein n=1 Tax=Hydrogenophaga taeniospiralis TaxID=65656 RepID=UPI001CFB8B3F|nr:hypothetical protein [Hydrogenophaga taeniospiralis]UCU94560.1 hypothetical protein KI616_01350 [Hydrogenophaga taeniospiralis]